MIGVAGLSHLGVVSAIAAASRGAEVVAFDPDPATIQSLRAGGPQVFEPGLTEAWNACTNRVRLTSDPHQLEACAVCIVARDVPTDDAGGGDPSGILQLAETVAEHLPSGACLVLMSQFGPGTTRAFKTGSRAVSRRQLHVHYQAETLVFGKALARAKRPERFIVGSENPLVELPRAYASFLASFDCPVLQMRYESAELAKVAINTFLAASVSVADLLADLCEAVGADWSEVVPALRLDARIGPAAYVEAGLGVGGGNLERDLATISRVARERGVDSGVVDELAAANRLRRGWLLARVHEEVLSQRHDPVLAIWGLTYKPETHSVRNSPALRLVEAISPVRVRAYDPRAELLRPLPVQATRVGSALAACDGADAVAILTPWQEFGSVDLSEVRRRMRGRVVIDPHGVLDLARCARHGLRWIRRGLPRPPGEVVP